MRNMYLGYNERDLAESPYARFFNPEMAPFQDHIAEALLTGGVAPELMYPIEQACEMNDAGYWPVENGYARTPDGGIQVFCLTDMPDVTPAMWDWWFSWHGSEPLRYKLWHPKAHVHVGWQDGRSDLTYYVGRSSNIVEYLGSERFNGSINFIPPSTLGLDEKKLTDGGEVAICARVSFPNTPVKVGWLLHHVRPVPGGSEMRSRMWFGGANVSFGDDPGPIARAGAAVAGRIARLKLPDPAELLAHGSQEMAHLAGFLPDLFEAFGGKQTEDQEAKA